MSYLYRFCFETLQRMWNSHRDPHYKKRTCKKTVMKFCQARLPSLLGLLVAETSIDGTEEYSRDVYDEYVEQRKCITNDVNRIRSCYTPIPMGAFYALVSIPVDNAKKLCKRCLTISHGKMMKLQKVILWNQS